MPQPFNFFRFLFVAILTCCASGCVVPVIVTSVDPALADLIAPPARPAPPLTAQRLPAIEPDDVRIVQVAAPFTPATPFSLDESPLIERSVLVRHVDSDRLAAVPHEIVSPSSEIISPIKVSAPPRIALAQIVDQPAASGINNLNTLQRVKPLRDISLNIAPPEIVNDQQQPIEPPHNYGAEALPLLASEQPFTRGDLVAAGYEWHPSAEGLTFCYQPLYFEEVNLERYGRSFGLLQPFVSATAFYGRIPALPYMAFARPARRCTDHAHWALPGYRLPQWEKQPLVPSITGSAAEVAAIYGIILLIP